MQNKINGIKCLLNAVSCFLVFEAVALQIFLAAYKMFGKHLRSILSISVCPWLIIWFILCWAMLLIPVIDFQNLKRMWDKCQIFSNWYFRIKFCFKCKIFFQITSEILFFVFKLAWHWLADTQGCYRCLYKVLVSYRCLITLQWSCVSTVLEVFLKSCIGLEKRLYQHRQNQICLKNYLFVLFIDIFDEVSFVFCAVSCLMFILPLVSKTKKNKWSDSFW